MNWTKTQEAIRKTILLPVLKIEDITSVKEVGKALLEGGLPAAEITFRSDCAVEAIHRMKKEYPDFVVAAGTIISEEQADQAMQAGADFLVSPGLDENLVRYCEKKEYTLIPGISTASEAQQAIRLGLGIVKFFPAETSGGSAAIKALSAPFPQLLFMPTGGINEHNIGNYLANPQVIGCGGSWMVKESLIKDKKFIEMKELVTAAVRMIDGYR